MVILITGSSCVGKTFMAQNLLEKYKIPYLSIDHLKMGICRSNNNCGFHPESPEEIIAEKLWPIIKEIIKTNIENNQNIIIEGCYFPDSIEDIENYISENERRKQNCIKYGIKYFEINEDYEKEIRNGYQWIEEELLEKINKKESTGL